MGISKMQIKVFLCLFLATCAISRSVQSEDPSPKAWPEQFHSKIFMIMEGSLYFIDLWYDYPKGRNFNIIQTQLGSKLWDLEWNNGTSYYYDLNAQTCFTILFPVGLIPPDWLIDGSHYLGVQEIDGFTCNVWEKEDSFVTYYEDVETRRPVGWYFRSTDQFLHIMTFEVGAILPDQVWQAPTYCFPEAVQPEVMGVNPPITFRNDKTRPREVVSSVVSSATD